MTLWLTTPATYHPSLHLPPLPGPSRELPSHHPPHPQPRPRRHHHPGCGSSRACRSCVRSRSRACRLTCNLCTDCLRSGRVIQVRRYGFKVYMHFLYQVDAFAAPRILVLIGGDELFSSALRIISQVDPSLHLNLQPTTPNHLPRPPSNQKSQHISSHSRNPPSLNASGPPAPATVTPSCPHPGYRLFQSLALALVMRKASAPHAASALTPM